MEPRRAGVSHVETADGAYQLPLVFSCWVPGTPQTKGSARGYGFKRGNGTIGVNITNDNPKAKEWQHRVAFFASEAMRQIQRERSEDAAFGLRIAFYFERPKTHVLQKKTPSGIVVKLSASGRARLHHTTKPDVDKAVRVILDALTGVLYKDDCQVVDTVMSKRYVMPGDCGSGVMIEAYVLNHAERWMPEVVK